MGQNQTKGWPENKATAYSDVIYLKQDDGPRG